MQLNSLKIAVVILNYNSAQDLRICAEQITQQKSVHFSIILVDNASQANSVADIEAWLAKTWSDAIVGTQDDAHRWIEKNSKQANKSGNIYFVKNHENRGYSAGNNIGIRLAESLGAEAVLIANPDMRIADLNYLSQISQKLFSGEQYVVAASTIRNISGANENPMRELSFWEELFWPFWMVLSRFGIHPTSQSERLLNKCKKVSGCCLLIRTSFLKSIGYFDEGVFLYCEEAILAAQIHNAGKEILYVPELEVLHAHQSSAKGNRIKRFKEWSKSRWYYHRNYTQYGVIRRFLLSLSHYVYLQMMRLQDAIKAKT